MGLWKSTRRASGRCRSRLPTTAVVRAGPKISSSGAAAGRGRQPLHPAGVEPSLLVADGEDASDSSSQMRSSKKTGIRLLHDERGPEYPRGWAEAPPTSGHLARRA